jgi:putative peptidoglycan lipid II flippase
MITFGKTAVASSVGGLAGLGVVFALRPLLSGDLGMAGQAWIFLISGSLAALVVTLATAWVVRLEELRPLWRRLAPR